MSAPVRAVIFDMDGVLLDSEPIWRASEIAVLGALGVPLTDELCVHTMGLRCDEVVRYWFDRYPWGDASTLARVESDIIDEVEQRVRREARSRALPGVENALLRCRAAGWRMGLASSSAMRLIHAVLDSLGVSDAFSVCRSAESEAWGKPHPAVYLATARDLEVAPTSCVAIEDSITGMIAAKAARMRCVMVPSVEFRKDPRLVLADAVLETLDALRPESAILS